MPDCEHYDTVYVAVYDQWYCRDCRSYMPRGWLPEHIECPYCHQNDTKYIERYDRYFCKICGIYLPEGYGPPREKLQEEGYSDGDPTVPDPADPSPAEDKCIFCYGPLLYISELKQYRCDFCEAYMPKGYAGPDPGPDTYIDKCPYCGGTNIVEIPRYHQLFCRDCNTYLPKGTVFQPPGGGNVLREDAEPGPFVYDAGGEKIEFDNLIPMSDLNMQGCGKQKYHHGPIVYVLKYKQYYCENCNHFTNIGWKPI